ncbi:MAG: 3-methyl-2-oxobutanoate hydroxymethyltransferase [Burkholderiales bacterium]
MTYGQAATKTRIGLKRLQRMHAEGEKITMVTCYDASFATLLEDSGVETLLIGDSLGMVLQGHDSTLPVTLDDIAYHTQCVARGAKLAFIIADMPFGSFQESPQQAFRNAATLMAAGAHMVKIEGGAHMAASVEFLATRGIPVQAHIGLTPQSVNKFGGYRVQGREDEAATRLLDEARLLQESGADMLLLEAIPASLAARITKASAVPTIGIGAGVDCSGQVLVLHDMLNIYPGRKARFVRNFMEGAASIGGAIEAYVRAVKDGSFPAAEHSF